MASVNKNEKAFKFEAVLGEGFDEIVSCRKGRFFFTMNIIIKDIHRNPQPSSLLSGYKPYFLGGIKTFMFRGHFGVEFDRGFQVLVGGWARLVIISLKKLARARTFPQGGRWKTSYK